MDNNETVVTDTTSEATESAPVASEETTNGVTPEVELEATEANPVPKGDVPDAFLDTFNLDDLLNADFSADEIMSTTHKELPDYNEILKHLPENGRKLISNLRAMTTRKTQEVADIKRALLEQQTKLEDERKALYTGRFAKNIEQLSKDPEKPHDLFTDAGMESKIQQEAAKLFKQMMEPVQEEMWQTQRQNQLDSFKRENPDLVKPEVRVEVARLLRDRPELKLEDAYYITKAQLDKQRLTELEQSSQLQKEEKKMTWARVNGGSNVNATKVPQFRDAWEAFQWHKANGQ